MKTESLNIYEVAQKIANIAEGETKRSLAIEMVRLSTIMLTGEPVYILYNEKEKTVYTTLSKKEAIYGSIKNYELIWIIKKAKELNKYKICKI